MSLIVQLFSLFIDKLGNGPEFEAATRQKQENNPKFSFLRGGDYQHYYLFRVQTEKARLCPLIILSCRLTSIRSQYNNNNHPTIFTCRHRIFSLLHRRCHITILDHRYLFLALLHHLRTEATLLTLHGQ